MAVLDVENGNVIWKAKNLPPDPQTLLQQPMWTTALQFLHTPTSSSSSSSSSDWFSNIGSGGSGPDMTLLATGTAYKQVQIYDIRASSSAAAASSSRRPVLYTPEHLLEHRITTLCQLADGYTLAVGDTVGDVHLLDMRKMHSGKQQYSSSGNKRGSSSGSGGNRRRNNAKEEIGRGRLVGPGGSIRQLYRHPTIPHYLGCVGYDRKLWMWNVSSRKMVECVYLKQRLNCLLICEDGRWSEKEEEDNMEDGEGRGAEYDDDVEVGDGGDLEDDEVQDYVDSDNEEDDDDDDDDDDDSGDLEETESEEELESGESDENDDDDEEIVSKQPIIKRQKK